jgi:hypothetical protein
MLAIGVLTMVGGCATTTLDGPIDYEVTGGFTGRGDGTPTIHIEQDGTMTRTTPDGPSKTETLDPATFRMLRDKIERAEFSNLAERYSCCADDYTVKVSVVIDGTVHTVEADRMAETPPALKVALDALDDIATRD